MSSIASKSMAPTTRKVSVEGSIATKEKALGFPTAATTYRVLLSADHAQANGLGQMSPRPGTAVPRKSVGAPLANGFSQATIAARATIRATARYQGNMRIERIRRVV